VVSTPVNSLEKLILKMPRTNNFRRINNILNRKDLSGILIPQGDSPSLEKASLQEELDNPWYQTEPNTDGIVIEYSVLTDERPIEYCLQMYTEDGEELVQIFLNRDGKLREEAKFHRTFEEKRFSDLNTQKGTSFEPIFEKMLDLYMERHYSQIVVKE